MKSKSTRNRVKPVFSAVEHSTPNVSLDTGSGYNTPFSPDIFNVTDVSNQSSGCKPTERRSIGGRVSKSHKDVNGLGRWNVKKKLRLFAGWMTESKNKDKDTRDYLATLDAENHDPNSSKDIFSVSPGFDTLPSDVTRDEGDSDLGTSDLLDYDVPAPRDEDLTPVQASSVGLVQRQQGNSYQDKPKLSRLRKTFTFRREKKITEEDPIVKKSARRKSKRARSVNKSAHNNDVSKLDTLDISVLENSPRRLNESDVLEKSSFTMSTIDRSLNTSHIVSSPNIVNHMNTHSAAVNKLNGLMASPEFADTVTPVQHRYFTRSASKAYTELEKLKNVRISDDTVTPVQRRGTSVTKSRLNRMPSTKAQMSGRKSTRRRLHAALSENALFVADTPLVNGIGIMNRQDAGHTPKATRRRNAVEYDERLI